MRIIKRSTATASAALQATCRQQFAKSFEALAWDEQTKVLLSLESGRAAKEFWKSPASGEFFNLMLEHTMQGFYGPPWHGGNHNNVSFKMLGLDFPHPPSRNRAPNGGKP